MDAKNRSEHACACTQPHSDAGQAGERTQPAPGLAELTHHEHVEEWSVDELIRHLIDEFHVPARRDTPRLLAEMEAARDAMAGGSAALDELARLVAEIARDLLDHMEKEENVLFPWIRSGRGRSAHGPIRAMTGEHSHSVEQLDHVRALRESLLRPDTPDAVISFLERLEAFEIELREHTRIENDVLFLRALQGW